MHDQQENFYISQRIYHNAQPFSIWQ